MYNKIAISLLIFFMILPVGNTLEPSNYIERSIQVFNQLKTDNMHILDNFYHPRVEFIDPVHKISGIQEIKKYYTHLYKNVEKIQFKFHQNFQNKENVFLSWTMTLTTKTNLLTNPIVLEGSSHIIFDPKTHLATYHRDYFDMGSLIYEQIPGLGFVIKKIKAQMQTH